VKREKRGRKDGREGRRKIKIIVRVYDMIITTYELRIYDWERRTVRSSDGSFRKLKS